MQNLVQHANFVGGQFLINQRRRIRTFLPAAPAEEKRCTFLSGEGDIRWFARIAHGDWFGIS
jgi:hypothetical protein